MSLKHLKSGANSKIVIVEQQDFVESTPILLYGII